MARCTAFFANLLPLERGMVIVVVLLGWFGVGDDLLTVLFVGM